MRSVIPRRAHASWKPSLGAVTALSRMLRSLSELRLPDLTPGRPTSYRSRVNRSRLSRSRERRGVCVRGIRG